MEEIRCCRPLRRQPSTEDFPSLYGANNSVQSRRLITRFDEKKCISVTFGEVMERITKLKVYINVENFSKTIVPFEKEHAFKNESIKKTCYSP